MTRTTFLMAICIANLLSTLATSESKTMICRDADDLFTQDGTYPTPTTTRRHQGAPGKRGAKGNKGDIGMRGVKGEQGDPGMVDYERVNATIEQLFDKLVEKSVAAKVGQLEEKIARLQESNEEIKEKLFIATCDGFVYLGECYVTSMHSARDVTYDKAIAMCEGMSGKVADILDKEHYDMVFNHVRTKMPSAYNALWLSMTIELPAKTVRLSSGTPVPYTKYYPGFPESTASWTQMSIGVRKSSSDANQGMFNYITTSTNHGVLCQKE